jgi:hypothetical protein
MEERVAELNTEGRVNLTRLLVGHFIALVDTYEVCITQSAIMLYKKRRYSNYISCDSLLYGSQGAKRSEVSKRSLRRKR